MDWLDGVIIIILLAAIVRGVDMGFARQLFSACGFFGGLFLGASIEDSVIRSLHTTTSRTVLSVVITLGLGLLFLVLGELLADRLKSRMAFTRLDQVDRSFGSVVAAATMLITVWLGASIFTNTPFIGLQRQIRDSAIVLTLNRAMPPAPDVIAKLGHLITPNGFPQVFTGAEPNPTQSAVSLPDMSQLATAVTKDQASVVKIAGEGCGGIVEGSGFVADDGIVITNAHVIAGVSSPHVVDKNGSHKTTVIWFNPDLDLAVLRSLGLSGKPLPLINKTVPSGTPAAVLGYPGGGVFQADPAAIVDAFNATGRNIYNQETATRQIYSMKADVISGNSGGPLINKNGAVVGIVFAHSTTYQDIGYALTMPQVVSELTQAKQNTEPVGTGSCAE